MAAPAAVNPSGKSVPGGSGGGGVFADITENRKRSSVSPALLNGAEAPTGRRSLDPASIPFPHRPAARNLTDTLEGLVIVSRYHLTAHCCVAFRCVFSGCNAVCSPRCDTTVV